MRESTRKVGVLASSCTAVFAVAYIVAQLFEWAGMLGSAGGPNSSSTGFGIYLLLTPSLLLGSAFVVAMAALHMATPEDRKVFSLAGLAFAIIYATLTGLVYFVQLTFVAPRLVAGETAGIELLLFKPYESFLFAIDLFGYTLMSAATLFAAFALPSAVGAKWTRRAMIANGAILPFLAFQMFVPALIWPAALWALTFPLCAILLVNLFRQQKETTSRSERQGSETA